MNQTKRVEDYDCISQLIPFSHLLETPTPGIYYNESRLFGSKSRDKYEEFNYSNWTIEQLKKQKQTRYYSFDEEGDV